MPTTGLVCYLYVKGNSLLKCLAVKAGRENDQLNNVPYININVSANTQIIRSLRAWGNFPLELPLSKFGPGGAHV